MAPPDSEGGIRIPDPAPTSAASGPEDSYQDMNGGGRDRDHDAPRRSSRSRSPGHRGDRRGPPDEGGNNPGNNLHVSSLSKKVDSRDLEAAFAKIGRVSRAAVMYDPHSRESRGFGFVTMESAEEADAAITALNGTDIMGKVISIQKARRGRARTPTPGRYYGPPKRHDDERPYDPRPYDSRYARDYDRGDRRGGRGGGGGGRDRDYDDRRSYRDDRDDRYYDRGGRDDRGGGGGDRYRERDRYDDRRR